MSGRTQKVSRPEAISLGVLVLGLLVLAAYFVMDLFSIGFFSEANAPGDHGEGALMMVGVSLISIGFIAFLTVLAGGRLMRLTRRN